jgi:hypothetical protein
MTALKSANSMNFFTESINYLTFTFIAPLQSKHKGIQ